MEVGQFARLTMFERRILSFVFAIEAPELLETICKLHVLSRKQTGVGMFIDFGSPHPPGEKPDAIYGASAFAYRDGWDDILRCQVAVRGGEVHHIELFSNHTDSFPDDLDALSLGYMEVVPRVPHGSEDKASVH